MDYVQVFHPLHGFGVCYGPAEILPPSEVGIVEHGVLVRCGVCGRLGVVAEPGHELEFLPSSTERTPDGRYVHRLPLQTSTCGSPLIAQPRPD
jgi:hypothetical protein